MTSSALTGNSSTPISTSKFDINGTKDYRPTTID
jgi:hypothetical protein